MVCVNITYFKVDGGEHVEDRETVRIDKNYDR
jgi:hypothetical protein